MSKWLIISIVFLIMGPIHCLWAQDNSSDPDSRKLTEKELKRAANEKLLNNLYRLAESRQWILEATEVYSGSTTYGTLTTATRENYFLVNRDTTLLNISTNPNEMVTSRGFPSERSTVGRIREYTVERKKNSIVIQILQLYDPTIYVYMYPNKKCMMTRGSFKMKGPVLPLDQSSVYIGDLRYQKRSEK